MSTLWQHLRFMIRLAAKNPGFTILAVLMLAIGISVNSAVFSLIDCAVLRPLPIKDSDQMVTISARRQKKFAGFSYSDCLDIQHQSKIFTSITGSSGHGAELALKGSSEMVAAEDVEGNYFSVLGITPEIGSAFDDSESMNPGDAMPVVISHGLWQRRFGGDPAVVGKTILLSRRNAVIRGVAPASYVGLRAPMMTELWTPMGAKSLIADPNERNSKVIEEVLGRMRPGATIEQARAELNVIAANLSNAYPAVNKGIEYSARPLNKSFIESFSLVAFLLGGPILILLICCANVSGMILAQIEARQNEFAVKLALGAGRRILLRQLLTESLLLSLLGTALGLLFASWLIALPPALMPTGPMELRLSIALNFRVIVFTLGIAIVAALFSGVRPAFYAGKSDLIAPLKDKSGVAEKGRFSFRKILVAGQVAFSVILLVTTGLFVRSLLFSEKLNLGFDSKKNLLIINAATMANGNVSSHQFFLPVVESVASIPGVKRASFAKRMLLSGSGEGLSLEADIPGAAPPAGQVHFVFRYNSVGRNYFDTVGTRILRGRAFDQSDELPNQRTVIVNEAMAGRFWPNADPIGMNVTIQGKNCEVVGVAQNNRMENIHDAPEPYLYVSFFQKPSSEGVILVETVNNPLAIAGAVKNKILEVDKLALVFAPLTLTDIMHVAYYQERMLALLALSLGILGAILSAVGLYAVVAWLAGKRTREIGIRTSLGAMNKDIFRLIIREGFRVSFIGIAIGLIASFYIARWLTDVLYGVTPADPISYIASAVAVLTISLAASYVPARRAIKADPMIALRNE